MNEYRPRIRVSRKRPVTRKGKYILTVCKTEDDAIAVTAFLETMFEAAKRDEARAKATMDQLKLDAQYTALVGAEFVADAAIDGVPMEDPSPGVNMETGEDQ